MYLLYWRNLMKDIRDSTGYLLNISARLIKHDLDSKMNEYGITTSQWAVLKLLSVESVLTQAQIADKLNSDRATCGSVIDRLVKKELIIKSMSDIDRRAYNISLSPQGKNLVEALTNHAIQSNHQALNGITDSDIKKLHTILNQIIKNLEGKS